VATGECVSGAERSTERVEQGTELWAVNNHGGKRETLGMNKKQNWRRTESRGDLKNLDKTLARERAFI